MVEERKRTNKEPHTINTDNSVYRIRINQHVASLQQKDVFCSLNHNFFFKQSILLRFICLFNTRISSISIISKKQYCEEYCFPISSVANARNFPKPFSIFCHIPDASGRINMRKQTFDVKVPPERNFHNKMLNRVKVHQACITTKTQEGRYLDV